MTTSSKPIVTEDSATSVLVAALENMGYAVTREVPSGSQSIDIVALGGDAVTAIEVKLNKWQVALDQCRSHEVCADFICIAVALKSIPDKLKIDARKKGYGLLQVNVEAREVSWVLRPKRNSYVWMPEQQRLISKVKEVAHEC